jgi:hypothetical protein
MQAQLFELYRAGIRSATDMMKLSLEQTERLQQQQLQLIRNALDENSRSSTQAGEARNIDDMIAFNSRLAGAQFERMAAFWSNWWKAAGEAQKSLIEQVQSQMGQANERMREGYNFAARASEDATRLAASQMSGVAQQERERSSKEHRKSA